MKIGRRLFLKGMASAVGFAGLRAMGCEALPAAFTAPKIRLRLGILSDIHLTTPESTETFETALTWFKEHAVDGVIIAGDMADHGLLSELQLAADTWYRVFPNDKGANGQHVEKLFQYGNHDLEGFTYGIQDKAECDRRFAISVAKDKEATWERLFHEPYEPVYAKTVKGYTIIGAHWHNWQGIPQVKDFMEKTGPKLDPHLPFFFSQHPHPLDTCMGPWAWGHDNGVSTRALSAFPNAIAFSGHSHYSLTDERSIWQGAFTSINTASLRYLYLPTGRENSDIDVGSNRAQMPNMDFSEGRQGMLMTVYDDYIVIERREFVYGESVGDDWILPLTGEEKRPYNFEKRSSEAVAPHFTDDAKVTVSQGKGKNRSGEETDQVTVSFPPASPINRKNPVLDYDVRAIVEESDIVKSYSTKRVYQGKCFLNESRRLEPVTCVFATAELPKNVPFRFAVYPTECFGKAGDPIYSASMELSQ